MERAKNSRTLVTVPLGLGSRHRALTVQSRADPPAFPMGIRTMEREEKATEVADCVCLSMCVHVSWYGWSPGPCDREKVLNH